MFAVISAVLFFLAFLFHGGVLTVHSSWFDTTGLALAGLFFLAIHLIPSTPVGLPAVFRRRP